MSVPVCGKNCCKKSVAFGIAFFILTALILPAVEADISLDCQSLQPLGDENSWSFEGDPNGWTTNNGGLSGNPNDYSIYALWQYRDQIDEFENCWFVKDASAAYCLNWQFNADTNTYFQIKVTADVMWAHVVKYGREIIHYYLVDDYMDTISKIVTIHA